MQAQTATPASLSAQVFEQHSDPFAQPAPTSPHPPPLVPVELDTPGPDVPPPLDAPPVVPEAELEVELELDEALELEPDVVRSLVVVPVDVPLEVDELDEV